MSKGCDLDKIKFCRSIFVLNSYLHVQLRMLVNEWRKFTSVIQSSSHSVIHSVNFPGGGGGCQILLMCETLKFTDIVTMFKQKLSGFSDISLFAVILMDGKVCRKRHVTIYIVSSEHEL